MTHSQHWANLLSILTHKSNIGPTDHWYFHVLDQCRQHVVGNIPHIGPTLYQHVGPVVGRWAKSHWANVKCQCWPNTTHGVGWMLGQRTLAIWVLSKYSLYIVLLYFIYHLCFTCIDFYEFSTWGGCWFVVYIRRFIYNFLNVCPFDYRAVAGSGKIGPVKPG